MANAKITDLTELTTLQGSEVMPVVDTLNDQTKKIAVSTLLGGFSGNVPDGSITTAKLDDNAVTAEKIKSDAVTTAKLNDGAVTEGKINNNAVTEDKILNGAVTALKLADTGVVANNYTAANITVDAKGRITAASNGSNTPNIGDHSITYGKIQEVNANKLLGRATGGKGDLQEIKCTTAGRNLLDDANPAAQRITLGLEIGKDVQEYDANTAKTDEEQTFSEIQTFQQQSVHTGGIDCDGNLDVDADVDVVGSFKIDGPYKQVAESVVSTIIDLSNGNYFTKTISGNTTFSFRNPPTSGTVGSFTLELKHISGTVGWPASVKWPNDTPPFLESGKTHLFVFITDNGGSRYRGAALVGYPH